MTGEMARYHEDGHDAAPPAERSGAERDAGIVVTVRRTFLALLLAVLIMAVFNSSQLERYASDLPVNSVSDRLVNWTGQWHELMLELGPAKVRPAVRDMLETVRAQRWPGQDRDDGSD